MSVGHVVRVVWPPLVFGLGFLALWEAVVAVFDLKPYFLATAIARSAASSRRQPGLGLGRGRSCRAANALVGLLVGTVLGVAMSFLLSGSTSLNEFVTPLAIALNAVPIFVLVAVLNNMFAITSEVPRRLMVTLVVYFIVLVNVAKGLTQVNPIHLELHALVRRQPTERSCARLRVPNAVPYLFTALKIAAPTSVITAFVSEYFGGSQNGLGYRITRTSPSPGTPSRGRTCSVPACSVSRST